MTHKWDCCFIIGVQLGLVHSDHKARKHHSVLFCFIVVLAVRTSLFACENGVRLASKVVRCLHIRGCEVLRAIYCEVILSSRPPMTKPDTRDCDVGLVIFVYIKIKMIKGSHFPRNATLYLLLKILDILLFRALQKAHRKELQFHRLKAQLQCVGPSLRLDKSFAYPLYEMPQL